MHEIDIGSPSEKPQAELEEKVRQFLRCSLAPSTLLQHRRRFKLFAAWCDQHRREALPASPETVALFLSDAAGRFRLATIKGYLDTIAFVHRAGGEPFDRQIIHPVVKGIARIHGTASRKVAPITIGELRTIIAALPNTIAGARDRAVLALGFAGALRTSEIVGLDMGVAGASSRGLVAVEPDGVRITLFRSKTDQKGKGIFKFLPRGGDPCPTVALEHWLSMAGIASGPVFRRLWRGVSLSQRRIGEHAPSLIVKKAVYNSVLRAGLGEAHARARANQVASHSLRVGFVTSAALAKVPSEDIAAHIGWVSAQMVFHYKRHLDPMENNPADLVLNC
jgi:integrase